jgi:2'-5' RNA ligase
MYFIAIVLPEELNEKIIQYKNYMHENYRCAVGLKSPAHITMMPPFWMEEEKEIALMNDIDLISRETEPFELSTNNFSAFKPRTIFVDVVANEKLNQLKKRADMIFGENENYKIKTESRPFHPHITIATRDLFKKDFQKAWPYFEEKKFLKDWVANGLSLLKHNKKNWDVVYTSQFKKF